MLCQWIVCVNCGGVNGGPTFRAGGKPRQCETTLQLRSVFLTLHQAKADGTKNSQEPPALHLCNETVTVPH